MAEAITDSGHAAHDDDYLDIDFDSGLAHTDDISATAVQENQPADDFDFQLEEVDLVVQTDVTDHDAAPPPPTSNDGLLVSHNLIAESEIGYEDEETLVVEANDYDEAVNQRDTENVGSLHNEDAEDEIDYEEVGDDEQDGNPASGPILAVAVSAAHEAASSVVNHQVLDDTTAAADVVDAGDDNNGPSDGAAADGYPTYSGEDLSLGDKVEGGDDEHGSTDKSAADVDDGMDDNEEDSLSGSYSQASQSGAPSRDSTILKSDILVLYKGDKYELCASTQNNDPETYFFAGTEELDDPFSTFFTLLRQVLDDDIDSSDELILRFDELKLEIREDSRQIFLEQASMNDILHLHHSLQENDGMLEEKSQLLVELVVQQSPQNRYSSIMGAVLDGVGLKFFREGKMDASDMSSSESTDGDQGDNPQQGFEIQWFLDESGENSGDQYKGGYDMGHEHMGHELAFDGRFNGRDAQGGGQNQDENGFNDPSFLFEQQDGYGQDNDVGDENNNGSHPQTGNGGNDSLPHTTLRDADELDTQGASMAETSRTAGGTTTSGNNPSSFAPISHSVDMELLMDQLLEYQGPVPAEMWALFDAACSLPVTPEDRSFHSGLDGGDEEGAKSDPCSDDEMFADSSCSGSGSPNPSRGGRKSIFDVPKLDTRTRAQKIQDAKDDGSLSPSTASSGETSVHSAVVVPVYRLPRDLTSPGLAAAGVALQVAQGSRTPRLRGHNPREHSHVALQKPCSDFLTHYPHPPSNQSYSSECTSLPNTSANLSEPQGHTELNGNDGNNGVDENNDSYNAVSAEVQSESFVAEYHDDAEPVEQPPDAQQTTSHHSSSHATSATSTINGDEIDYDDNDAANEDQQPRAAGEGENNDSDLDEIDWGIDDEAAEEVPGDEDLTNLSSPGLTTKRSREVDDETGLEDDSDAKRRKL